jgi:HlyD family secretion protein
MNKKVIKAIISCAIVGTLGFGGYYGYSKQSTVKASSLNKYFTATAKKSDLQVDVQTTGTAYAATTKYLVSNNSVIISCLNVQEGDMVKEGDTICTVNNSSITDQVTKAQLTLDQQNLQLQNAKSDQVPQQTLAVEQAQADLNSAVNQENNMTLNAPISGMITNVTNSTGDNIQSGKTILTVVDNTTLRVKVSIDELDISKVQVGQKAEITFDALSGKTYDGNVDSISPVGTSTNGVTTYDAVISIKNPDGVRIGMNANVDILVSDKQDALTIPSEALIQKNGNDYVLVADPNSSSQGNNTTSTNTKRQYGNGNGNSNNKTTSGQSKGKLVQVQVGLENSNMVEITSGLNEGDKVLIALPQTSSSNSKNSMSGGMGFGGGMGSSQRSNSGSGKSGQ